MAAGKNAASDILSRRGFACVDADVLVHQLLAEPRIQERVLAEFGAAAKERGISLANADGSLNRRALGALLFADKALLARQEALLHPEVDALISAFVAAQADANIVLNATVLYKTASMRLCNAVIFIDAPLLTRFFRARRRDGMKAAHILARFWQQRNLFAKYKNANADIHKVSNTGDLRALEKKLDAVLAKLAF